MSGGEPHSTSVEREGPAAGWTTQAKGLDEYSDVLGMTPREHERRMRKWYVALGIVLFFAVFGEWFLMAWSRRGAPDVPPPASAPR